MGGGGAGTGGGNCPAKMACYKEIDDLLKRRGKPTGGGGAAVGSGAVKSPTVTSKIDSYLQFDKGIPLPEFTVF